MPDPTTQEQGRARASTNSVLSDLCDRGGFDDWWDVLADDVRAEIVQMLNGAFAEALKAQRQTDADTACGVIASMENSECDHDPKHRTVLGCAEAEVDAALRGADA